MYIEREIKEKFEKLSNVYNVLAVVGARQSGKTTFLKENLKSSNSSYLLFDDPDIRGLFEEDIKKFEEQYIKENKINILDEAQYCKEAGRKLKYLADTGKKLWITASSEIILSQEILSFLVGRVSIIKLYPFSLREFLNSKNQVRFTRETLQRNIWEHLTYGGYPRVVLNSDVELKKSILIDLYNTMVLKDIAKTFSISDSKTLEEFVRYLSFNIGGLLSYESISKNLNISFQSTKKYLDAMEKSYLISRVKPFFKNKIREIIKQPKIYFIDTGLRNSISKEFKNNPEGNVFENYVFSELIKLNLDIKYWRTKTGLEVDFIVEKQEKNEIIPIEVKLKTPDKLSNSFKSFIETYKPKKAFIIVYENKLKVSEKSNKINKEKINKNTKEKIINKKENKTNKDKFLKKLKYKSCEIIITDVFNMKDFFK